METIYFTLTIIRHAQSEGNANGLVQGITDGPLTELGRTQAQGIGQTLRNESFDLAFSSDLSRAYETGLAIVGDPDRLVKDKLLREWDFGRFENRPKQEIFEAISSQLGNVSADEPKIKALLNFRDETVETEESVESRAKAFMMKLAQEIAVEGKDEMKVLVTSHGLLIRSILIHLHKTAGKKTNFPPIDSWFYQVSPNTGMTKLKISLNKSTQEISEVILEWLYRI